MLDMEMSTEHQLFRQTAREFAEKEVAPGYLERSKSDDFPWELYRLMGRHGFLGLNVPPEYGGQGVDAVSMGIALEELGKADPVAAMLAFFSGVGFFVDEAADSIKKISSPVYAGGRRWPPTV